MVMNNKINENLDVEVGNFEEENFYGLDPDKLKLALENASSVCLTNDDNDFYIVYYSTWKAEVEAEDGSDVFEGIPNVYDIFDHICDEVYGLGNWGDGEEYISCDNCNRAINTTYDKYFQSPDSGYSYCESCVEDDPYGTHYLQNIENDYRVNNTMLSSYTLEDNGWERLETYDTSTEYGRRLAYDDKFRKSVLDGLLDRHPNGKFIFDASERWYIGIWAYTQSLSDDESED